MCYDVCDVHTGQKYAWPGITNIIFTRVHNNVLIEAKGQMLYSYCFSYFLSFEPPPPPPPYCNLSFTLVSMLFLNSCGESSQRVSYDLITLQLFKNSIDTQEKLRLNLYSLSVSVSKLSEYRR